MYGVVAQVTGSMRYSILFLITFFIGGIILLFRVPKKAITN
jgi:MFS transporter, UMF1 family